MICACDVTTVLESAARSPSDGVGAVGAPARGSAIAGGADGVTAGALVAGFVETALTVWVLSALCVVARRDDGKNLGVMTMTSAIKTSARMVRLSMQVGEVAREPDRSRRDGMDDSARFAARPTTCHGARHAARALQWRMLSSLDNNGTTMEVAATESPGNRAPSIRGGYALWLQTRLVAGEPGSH